MTLKQLAIFVFMFVALAAMAFVFCYAWAQGILYIDRTVPDPRHSGLTIGLSIGYVIPLGATAGLGGVAYAIADEFRG